jgi:ribulose-phosphate 3-epimerase
MVEVIPSILTNDRVELEEMLSKAEGAVSRVQIDIIDGQFAANRTIDPSVLSEVDTSLLLDFHLMTKEPINWVERAKTGGADRIIGQIEMMGNQEEFIGKVQETGAGVGLGIDLMTPVSSLEKEIMTSLDVVLVMSVKAGFGGEKFDESAIPKIEELVKIRENGSRFKICVDGGIWKDSIPKIKEAGADEVSIGKRVFNPSVVEALDSIKNLL